MRQNIQQRDERLGDDDPISYSVQFASGASFSGTLQEVLRLPNSGSTKIKSIRIASGIWSEPRISLTFDDNRYGSVSYTVDGGGENTFFVASKIEELIDRTIPWYSRIAVGDFMKWIFGLFMVFLVGAPLLVSILGLLDVIEFRESTAESQAIGNVIFLGGMVALAATGGLLGALKRRLFPIATFAINDGEERYSRLKIWRGVIGGGVFLALTINIVAAFIYGWVS